MPKLRILSGKEVIAILETFGFSILAQRGSHMKLRRIRDEGNQTLTVPNHPELDRGTLQAVYRQATRYISEEELRPHFYTK